MKPYYERAGISLYLGDTRAVLPQLPERSCHICVTSPPYYALRNYGADGQIGLEQSPAEYLTAMGEVFRGVWRVLRDDATCWLNMGDTYSAGTNDAASFRRDRAQCHPSRHGNDCDPKRGPAALGQPLHARTPLASKNMLMMPARLALALQDAGWYLRQDIIWHKPAPLPESVQDRCTKAHEYVYLLAKEGDYFYDADAIREDATAPPVSAKRSGFRRSDMESLGMTRGTGNKSCSNPNGSNARSVWTIPPQPTNWEYCRACKSLYVGSERQRIKADADKRICPCGAPDAWVAHFAAFPDALPERCIRAGTSEKGVCVTCGAQWERQRQIDRSFESGSGRAGNMPSGKNGQHLQGGGATLDVRRGPTVHVTTTGWEPTCECCPPDIEATHWEKRSYHEKRHYWRDRQWTTLPETVPATVLDPFSGTGTTLIVAARLGRNAVGIELSEPYAEAAAARIDRELNLRDGRGPLFTEEQP